MSRKDKRLPLSKTICEDKPAERADELYTFIEDGKVEVADFAARKFEGQIKAKGYKLDSTEYIHAKKSYVLTYKNNLQEEKIEVPLSMVFAAKPEDEWTRIQKAKIKESDEYQEYLRLKQKFSEV